MIPFTVSLTEDSMNQNLLVRSGTGRKGAEPQFTNKYQRLKEEEEDLKICVNFRVNAWRWVIGVKLSMVCKEFRKSGMRPWELRVNGILLFSCECGLRCCTTVYRRRSCQVNPMWIPSDPTKPWMEYQDTLSHVYTQ